MVSPYVYHHILTNYRDQMLSGLANSYSELLNLNVEATFAALSELQSNAVEKLKQRDRFKESGYATIKIKVLGQVSPKLLTKEVLLSSTGLDLKVMVSNDINLPIEKFKLICGGVIIKEKEMLSQQGVKNGNQILAITLSESVTDLHENENQFRDLECTKADTTLLACDNSYMQLEDRQGNIINIPAKEKKSLMVAMTLHEKGRNALKK